MGKLFDFASYFFAVPYVPKEGESVRSWILFNFYAENDHSTAELFFNMNNLALKNNVHYVIFPMQSRDRYYEQFKKRSFTNLEFSILQKNERATDDVFLDIRDL